VDTPVVVVYEACFSGSFIDASTDNPQTLSGPNRVVITSADDNEYASFLDDGAVSFSHFFFEDAGVGKNLLQSFNRAVSTIDHYQGFDQSPQLDDNGDRVYTVGSSPYDDGWLAEDMYLGVDPLAPTIEITATATNRHITPGLSVSLWAEVESLNELSGVTAQLTPPDPSVCEGEPPAVDCELDLEKVDEAGNWSRWELDYTGFTQLGTYRVEMNATDINSKEAVPRQFIITVSEGAYPGDPYETDDTQGEAKDIVLNQEIQLRNFHVSGDHDWIRFLAVSGVHYDIRTIHPGGSSCDGAVDTKMTLHPPVGLPLTVDDGGGCGTDGPAAILDYLAATSGLYYVEVYHGTGAFGPGSEYLFGVGIDEGFSASGRVKVLLNSEVIDDASYAKVHCQMGTSEVPFNSVDYPCSEKDPYCYFSSITTMSSYENGVDCWAVASFSRDGTDYSNKTSSSQLVRNGDVEYFDVKVTTTSTPTCPPAAQAAGRHGVTPRREELASILGYLLPTLLLIGLWRRRRGQAIR
jgi:hypothetical protein